MCSNNKIIRILILIAYLSLFIPFHSGYAQTEQLITLEDLGFANDETFQGVLVNRIFGIELPKRWLIEDDAVLTIIFSHSEALHPSSSMSVDWNGERVGSTMLTKLSANKGKLEIILSADQIISGFNALEVQFFMGISDDFCFDYDNPAVWAVVHNQTSIKIDPVIASVAYDLNLAPGYLIDSSIIEKNEITFLVPEKMPLPHLNTLAVGSATLGQLADWRNLSTDVISFLEAERDQPAGNLILIGTIAQLSAINPLFLPESLPTNESDSRAEALEQSLSESDGLIALMPSPYNPDSIALVLTGLEGAGVEKSARAFADNQFMNNVTGNYAIIKSIPKVEQHSPLVGKEISFESLGFNDQTAFGTREQTILYNIPLNALWNIDTEAVLEIRLLHSKLLSEPRSTLSVFVNGVPVGSSALDASTAEDGTIRLRIPLRFFEVGNNTLTFQSTLQFLDRASDWRFFCTDETFTRAWLTIRADSRLIFPEAPLITENNIINFPFGYLDPGSFDHFKFVMVPEADHRVAELMSKIATELGKYSLGETGLLEVIEPKVSFDENNDDNLVFIGLSEPGLLAMINDHLPLPFDVQTWEPQPASFLVDYEPIDEGFAIIQSFSPKTGRLNLLITAEQTQGLINAGEVLTDPGLKGSLNGQIAFVTSSTQAFAILVEEPAIVSPIYEEVLPQSLESQVINQPVWVINYSVIIIGVSVIILIASIFQLRKSEENDDKASFS